MSKFSKFQIASFKRTAQNVYPLVRRKEKLTAQIAEANAELQSIQVQIDAYQGPIKKVTGGYTTEDLIERVVVPTGAVDKNGQPIKMTQYKLRYPDTIIPLAVPSCDNAIAIDCGSNSLDNTSVSEETEDDVYNQVVEEEHKNEETIDQLLENL